jgi:mannose-6-phosphate isomerase
VSQSNLYPLLLKAALHVKVWGGRQLEQVMNKPLPTDEPYGESWEVHDSVTVVNGPLAGRKLGELAVEYGDALLGDGNNPAEGLPLLVKLLDASDWLSVQVHPNDEQARQLEQEPRGKTEAWYVIAAEPDSRLVIGVVPGTAPEAIDAAIKANQLEGVLVYETVKAGDVLSIPAGTIHALGPGLLIYEIQQSSDTTYRLYDWGRVGLDGSPRELHIDKSITVANTTTLPAIVHTADDQTQRVRVVETPFFITWLYQLNPLNGTTLELDTVGRRFHTLTCIEGSVAVVAPNAEPFDLTAGRSALIPASVGGYQLEGTGRVLLSSQLQ